MFNTNICIMFMHMQIYPKTKVNKEVDQLDSQEGNQSMVSRLHTLFSVLGHELCLFVVYQKIIKRKTLVNLAN